MQAIAIKQKIQTEEGNTKFTARGKLELWP